MPFYKIKKYKCVSWSRWGTIHWTQAYYTLEKHYFEDENGIVSARLLLAVDQRDFQ